MRNLEKMQLNIIKKNIKNFYIPLYESSKITIPDSFLATYLMTQKDLHEISKKFCKDFNL